MPGALYGEIVSVEPSLGSLYCSSRQEFVVFDNAADSLKVSDLTGRYRPGMGVAFLWRQRVGTASLVLPMSALVEGVGTVTEIYAHVVRGRTPDGRRVYFSKGRLSEQIPKSCLHLKEVLQLNDAFEFRATLDRANALRAIEIKLLQKRTRFDSWGNDSERVGDEAEEEEEEELAETPDSFDSDLGTSSSSSLIQSPHDDTSGFQPIRTDGDQAAAAMVISDSDSDKAVEVLLKVFDQLFVKAPSCLRWLVDENPDLLAILVRRFPQEIRQRVLTDQTFFTLVAQKYPALLRTILTTTTDNN